MNWYYVENGQQAGPVDDAQLQELVRSGSVQPDTLVWHEGLANWQAYRELGPAGVTGVTAAAPPSGPPLGAAPAAASDDEAVCAECNRVFSKQDMIQYGTVHVCAGCKPIFLQKLSEGVSVGARRGRRPLPVNADELVREILARDYRVDIGSCISRGWATVKSNLGLTIGATFLVMLCNQAAGFIPLLGIIASLILQGPLLGGLNVFYLKLIRGEPAGIADAFAGFSKAFWRLCGTFLLMALLIYLSVIPAAVYGFATMRGGQSPDVVFLVLMCLGVLGLVYVAIGLIFALPLSADLELGPMDSLRVSFRVVSRHWLSIFALMLVAGLVSALGLLACIVGIFVTLPIFYAATLHAYEDIFGLR